MRGKTAKRIRREAIEDGVAREGRAYDSSIVGSRFTGKWDTSGKPEMIPMRMVSLKKDCSRAIYQSLKKSYKLAKAA
jgi:hypothetical protein